MCHVICALCNAKLLPFLRKLANHLLIGFSKKCGLYHAPVLHVCENDEDFFEAVIGVGAATYLCCLLATPCEYEPGSTFLMRTASHQLLMF